MPAHDLARKPVATFRDHAPSLLARGDRRHGFIARAGVISLCHRALDEAAAEHARLALARIVENAGRAGRNAVLAVHQFDLVAAVGGPQPASLWRPANGGYEVELVDGED